MANFSFLLGKSKRRKEAIREKVLSFSCFTFWASGWQWLFERILLHSFYIYNNEFQLLFLKILHLKNLFLQNQISPGNLVSNSRLPLIAEEASSLPPQIFPLASGTDKPRWLRDCHFHPIRSISPDAFPRIAGHRIEF